MWFCSKKNENPQEEKNLLPIKAIFVADSQTAGKGRCKKILPNIEKECKQRNLEYYNTFLIWWQSSLHIV